MTGLELINHLRLLASYHMGTDLADRLANAERTQKQQREALAQAADEIERLAARVKELEVSLAGRGDGAWRA